MNESKLKRRVLILCTGNSCRSQMAEGLWRTLVGAEWEVLSAGSKPAGYVHPLAVVVMNEIGIDISLQESKHVDAFAGQAFDLVLTICDGARASCPVFHEASSLVHWSIADPSLIQGASETKLQVFQKVRDQIKHRIEELLGVDAK